MSGNVKHRCPKAASDRREGLSEEFTLHLFGQMGLDEVYYEQARVLFMTLKQHNEAKQVYKDGWRFNSKWKYNPWTTTAKSDIQGKRWRHGNKMKTKSVQSQHKAETMLKNKRHRCKSSQQNDGLMDAQPQ